MKQFVKTVAWVLKSWLFVTRVSFKDFIYWMTGEYFTDEELYRELMKMNKLFYSAPIELPNWAWAECNKANAEWNDYCEMYK